MVEELKHECGVAMIRLLKPLSYYERKYGIRRYGFDKLYLMMEKQHNRGQEGAGIASVSLDNEPGTEYMFREKAEGKDAITEIFKAIDHSPLTIDHSSTSDDCVAYDGDCSMFNCQLLMGHLRYSTTGKSGLQYVHPFLRRNNWRAKNLCLCGNFNMTNIDEVFHFLTEQGQSPRIYGDSYITLELMGHRLDREVERLYVEAKEQGLEGTDITDYIDNHVEMANVLKTTMTHFDGGYVMCGLRYLCALCLLRVLCGIRPGEALIVHRNGESRLEQIMPAQPLSACSFERIYFSRGSDRDIYQERKRLGEQLTPAIMKAVDGDVANTVFSYIPNTASVPSVFSVSSVAFRQQGYNVRTEKVVWKDIKLPTFIADNSKRNDLCALCLLRVLYGSLKAFEDSLVIIDDSIVRGTTLKESIFKILDRLHPKKIVMVSSSPQIRYPDYYGIDMSRLEELCAFRAAIALIKERGKQKLIADTYRKCKESMAEANSSLFTLHSSLSNHVRNINGQWSMVNGQWSMVNGQWITLKIY